MPIRAFAAHQLRNAMLTFVLLISADPVAAQDDSSQRILSATYEGKISGWNVELDRTLTQYPDGRYLLRSHASKVFASIEETSLFRLNDGRIQPLEYRYERSVFGKKAVERIVYDWDALRAQYTRSDRKKNNTEHKLTPGLLDPALYQLAIQADLAKGHQDLQYRFIKRKRIEGYDLLAKTDETVSFAGKKYQAAVVLRDDPKSEKSTKVWVLPELDYMIARIQHIDKDGDEFEISLAKYAADKEQLDRFYRAFSNNSNAGVKSRK